MAFKRTTKVLSDTAMSSMTDLVFLLLIFFLITSTLVNPNALKVKTRVYGFVDHIHVVESHEIH